MRIGRNLVGLMAVVAVSHVVLVTGCVGKKQTARTADSAVEVSQQKAQDARVVAPARPAGTLTTAGLTPKSMPAHPFMLFGQAEISSIAKRKDRDPLLDECWTRLSNLANRPDVFDDKSQEGRQWDRTEWWDQLIARAFVGKVSNNPEMIQQAITLMRRGLKESKPYEFYGGKEGDFHFHAGPLVSLALAWDWLYHDMTPEQRAEFLPGMETWCDACYSYNNTQWWREASYNVGAISIGGLGILSLAIRPDSTNPNTALWLREATRRIGQNFYPVSWKPSGICWEGPNYAIVGLEYPAMFSECLRRAGGDDQFGQSGAMHAMQYLMHQWMPQEGCAPIGDNTAYGRRTFAAEYLMGIARTRDAVGLWTWRNYTDLRRIDSLITYLWYPVDLKPVSPAEAKAPTGKYFEVTENRAGYFFSRTKWNDPDAAFFAFVTRHERSNHQHYDMNSFLLAGFGTLFATHDLIFPYGSENHAVDFEHNMIIVDDGGWPKHDDKGSCGDANSTEGALVGLATGPFADYVRGDAKWSYRDNSIIIDNPAIRAERSALFVKAGATPYMLTFDDIQFSHDAHTYKWQWYVPLDVPIRGTGTAEDPVMLAGKKGCCAIQFVTPDKPSVTAETVKNDAHKRWSKDLQKITAVQKGVRSRFVAVATLQQDAAVRPAVQVQPVQCENDSAGAAQIRLSDGCVDRIVWQSEEVYEQRGSDLASDRLQTDGLLAIVRVRGSDVVGYVLGEGTYLKWGDKVLVQAKDSVCVSADADGAKVFGRRQSRKGLPTVEPVGVRTFKPSGR